MRSAQPLQPCPVTVAGRDGVAIAGQHAEKFVGAGAAGSGQDTRCFAGEPGGAQAADRGGELLSLVPGDLVEDGGAIDDQGGASCCLGSPRGPVGGPGTALTGSA